MRTKVLIFLMFSLLLCMLVGCGNAEIPSKETGTQEPLQEDTENLETEAPEEEPDDRGIPGSSSYDITLGLENAVGFEKAEYKRTSYEGADHDTISAVNSHEDTTLGVTFDYSITADSDYEIIGASFGITDARGTISNETFIALAQNYLGYVSTVPYDTSDSETTRAWVEEQIPVVADAEGESSLTVGDVEFTLYGIPSGGPYNVFWLDFEKVA